MPDLPVIELDEATHTYLVDGRPKPSVTEILSTLIKLENFNSYVDTVTGATIPADMIEGAGDFGRAVHKASKLIMECKNIDMDKLPEVLHHAISELKRWRTEYAVEPKHLEMPVYCPKLDVPGTLDWTGFISGNDVLNLVDYKTTENTPTVGPQTWAYEQGYRAVTGYRGIIKRWVLYLPKKEGSYKFVELKSPMDEHAFRSANYLYHWRRR